MVNMYGTKTQMEQNANAIYLVTNTSGRKQTYYMFNRLRSTNSKWPGSKKVLKGWICVLVPGEDNSIDKCVSYEYQELTLAGIEDTWFNHQLGVKNYQQVKYDPIVIENYDDYDSDMDEDPGIDNFDQESNSEY